MQDPQHATDQLTERFTDCCPPFHNTPLLPCLPAMQNLSWVAPLKRNILTVAALINTGSLWLYEGATSNSPAPLLVARVINRGMNCEIQTPDVKLTQPPIDPVAGIAQCQKLDGGAMRPPGVWDGGVSGGHACRRRQSGSVRTSLGVVVKAQLVTVLQSV